jgi:hypothetical protein
VRVDESKIAAAPVTLEPDSQPQKTRKGAAATQVMKLNMAHAKKAVAELVVPWRRFTKSIVEKGARIKGYGGPKFTKVMTADQVSMSAVLMAGNHTYLLYLYIDIQMADEMEANNAKFDAVDNDPREVSSS